MTDEDLQSEFNSNVASLMRIDKLLQSLHHTYFMEDWNGMFKHLRGLRMEAVYKMNHKIKDGKCTKECPLCECDRLFNKLKQVYGIYTSNSEVKEVQLRFTHLLDNFQLFLMDFMGKKGMLLCDADDTRGL